MGKRPGNIFSRQRKALKEGNNNNIDINTTAIIEDNDRLNHNLKKTRKQLENNNKSLRKMKKRGGVMRQMLEKFPASKNHLNNQQEDEVEVATVTEEPIYESRKLMIRQMQGMIAKEVLKDRKGTVGSEYDSWSDLEENFARAYEPIPLNIRMETWRNMSKKEILRNVKSKQLRKDFEYLTHAEILLHIEKMHLSAQYLSNKFGVDKLLQHNHPPLTHRQMERAKQKGRDVDLDSIVTDFNELEMRKVHHQKPKPKVHDSWSSRASSILKDPASIYVSREEVLANLKADILAKAQPPKEPPPKQPFNNHGHLKPLKKSIHDSWSSRASSIMAKGITEPNYMSRTELLTKLAELSHIEDVEHLENLTKMIHEQDSDSELEFSSQNEDEDGRKTASSSAASVSTVKNVILTKHEIETESSQNKHHHSDFYTNNNSSDEDGSCSCDSCVSYSSCHTNCSCGGTGSHYEEEAMMSSMTTNTDETVVDQTQVQSGDPQSGRDKRKYRDVYIVNGSNVSDQNDPIDPILPKNLKPKQKQSKQENIPRNYSTTPSSMNEIEIDQGSGSKRSSKRRTKNSKDNTNADLGTPTQKSWSNGDFEEMYEPVNATEIRRQKNATALKRYLREFAADWDDRVNNLNTLRRGKVLQELKRHLRETIDLDNVKPEDLGRQVEVALREALDSSYEAISNVNIGQMYVPMEENPSNSRVVSRENTDYDTFGSIDSLIFEPKLNNHPTNEDIEQAQEEIDLQFNYLKQFDVSQRKKAKNIIGPGKTTFAERVKLFQSLGSKKTTLRPPIPPPPPPPPPKQANLETNWKKVAQEKSLKPSPDEIRAEEELESHSFCPECNNPMLESLMCSTCYTCTQCGEDEERGHEEDTAEEVLEDPYNPKVVLADVSVHQVSSGTASWDFVESTKANSGSKPLDENNLRRMLKESFGAEGSLDKQPVYEPLIYSASDMEHNLEYEVDFLSEYAQKKSLFPSSTAVGMMVEPKVQLDLLDKSGQKVRTVTEETFRADIEGTLRRLDQFQSKTKSTKGKSNARRPSPSELNASDSGIASPPLGQNELSSFTQVRASPSSSEEEQGNNDSGLENNEGNKKVPQALPVPKRDTMIRELKSKLKQKFSNEELAEQEREREQLLLQEQNEVAKISQVESGTVESRKLAMAPQLAKVFAKLHLQNNPEKSTMTSFANLRDQRGGGGPPQKLGEIRENSESESCDCDNNATEEKPTREMLYGPGGLFGPKGPFSTPIVRYPQGMELPPRKKIFGAPSTRASTRAPSSAARKTPLPHLINSEISSVVEDRSVKSHYIMNSVIESNNSKPPSRMETYLNDWAELPEDDVEKWKEEKAQRMLAWIHTSTSEQIGTETPWLKVCEHMGHRGRL